MVVCTWPKMSHWHQMFCHDLEVIGLNTVWLNLRDHGPAAWVGGHYPIEVKRMKLNARLPKTGGLYWQLTNDLSHSVSLTSKHPIIKEVDTSLCGSSHPECRGHIDWLLKAKISLSILVTLNLSCLNVEVILKKNGKPLRFLIYNINSLAGWRSILLLVMLCVTKP